MNTYAYNQRYYKGYRCIRWDAKQGVHSFPSLLVCHPADIYKCSALCKLSDPWTLGCLWRLHDIRWLLITLMGKPRKAWPSTFFRHVRWKINHMHSSLLSLYTLPSSPQPINCNRLCLSTHNSAHCGTEGGLGHEIYPFPEPNCLGSATFFCLWLD